jgi:hypothetical protein
MHKTPLAIHAVLEHLGARNDRKKNNKKKAKKEKAAG